MSGEVTHASLPAPGPSAPRSKSKTPIILVIVVLVLMRWTPEQIIIVLLAAPSLPTTRAAFHLARSSRFTLQTSMIAGRVAP
jgi:hypothetical protein